MNFVIGVLIVLILLGAGILLKQPSQNPTVEIISSPTASNQKNIFVDLGGAVQRPGLYELSTESRMNDLLIRAGGLSAAADREWVSKNLNLAQKLVDGAKIYVPKISDPGSEQSYDPGSNKQVNINTASAAQLDSLWGIGEKRTADIIANRPYQTIEELVTKAKIPKNVFEKIKEKITVY